MANQNKNAKNNGHPYDFKVIGPRHLSKPGWLEVIRSSWLDANYKRIVMACMVMSAYLLEMERQENPEEDATWAPEWWKFFKYRVVEILVDERDDSIFGAMFEWDMLAALGDLLVGKPFKAPMIIIAIRGTLLSPPTIRIDIEDDLRIFAKEDLTGSYRFDMTLEAVRRAVGKYGSSEVSMAGHSLGAGVALQVGRALALEGISIETHLFNPPSVSLPLALRCVGDKFGRVMEAMTRAINPFFKRKRNNDKQSDNRQQIQNWVPNLYINCNDSVCCHYSDYCERPQEFIEVDEKLIPGRLEECGMDRLAVKVYVIPKVPNVPMNPLQAHKLSQWWSHQSQPLTVLNGSTLIQHQLGSLVHPKNNSRS